MPAHAFLQIFLTTGSRSEKILMMNVFVFSRHWICPCRVVSADWQLAAKKISSIDCRSFARYPHYECDCASKRGYNTTISFWYFPYETTDTVFNKLAHKLWYELEQGLRRSILSLLFFLAGS